MLPEPAGGETVPTMNMVSTGFTNLQDNITYNSGSATDALGRTFPHGTILDPATKRQLSATGLDPVTGLTGTPGSYVRDPFYGCSASGCASFAGNSTTNFATPAAEAMLNIIPSSRIDPNAVKLVGVYPAPLSSGLANNYSSYVPHEGKNTNTWDIRIDENINANNSLFGVFDGSLFAVVVPSNLPGVAVGGTGVNQRQPARLRVGGGLHAHLYPDADYRYACRHGAQRQTAAVVLLEYFRDPRAVRHRGSSAAR